MLDRQKHVEEIVDGAMLLKRKMAANSPDLLKTQRITPSQWLVIGYIAQNEGKTTKEVAEALQMSGSAVTQLVNGLVAKKHITRQVDPQDKRAYKLILSKESRSQMQIYKKKRVQLLLKMFEVLSDSEFKQYARLLKKVLDSTSK